MNEETNQGTPASAEVGQEPEKPSPEDSIKQSVVDSLKSELTSDNVKGFFEKGFIEDPDKPGYGWDTIELTEKGQELADAACEVVLSSYHEAKDLYDLEVTADKVIKNAARDGKWEEAADAVTVFDHLRRRRKDVVKYVRLLGGVHDDKPRKTFIRSSIESVQRLPEIYR